MKYDKQSQTPEELAHKLISKNLQGITHAELSRILSSISYYRLRGYIYYYFHSNSDNKIIKEYITWDNIWNDYNFDNELRTLLYREIGKIEVVLRTLLVNTFSEEHGPLWYNDSTLFYDNKAYEKDINELNKNWARSNEKFKSHFTKKYQSPPPCWMIFETASFGNLSKIYENIKKCSAKENIAKYFEFNKNTESILISWFRHLVFIRNIIAHYGRLFSKHFITQPKNFKQKCGILGNNTAGNKLFITIVITAYLLRYSGNDYIGFIRDLKCLLNKYPTVNIDLMGFPANWENTPIFLDE